MEDSPDAVPEVAPPRLLAQEGVRLWFSNRHALTYSLCISLSYIFWTLMVTVLLGDQTAAWEAHLETVPLQLYDRTICVYGAALMMDLLVLMFERNPNKTAPLILECTIKCLALSNNCLVYAGMAAALPISGGSTLILQRYIQWAHTTPTMLLLLGVMANSQETLLLKALFFDEVMIVTGAIAACTTGWWSALNMALSFGAFVPIVVFMYTQFTAVIDFTRSSRSGPVSALRILRIVTMVVWSMFGIIWLLDRYGVLSHATIEVLMTMDDFLAKLIFSQSLFLGNIASVDLRRIAMMRAVELCNKEKVISELQDLVAQKERFMSSVSHELRTPLNGIIGLSDGLLNDGCGVLATEVRRQVQIIRTSGLRLLALINDIMDAAALRRSQLVLKQETVNLQSLINDVMDLTLSLIKPNVKLVNIVPAHCRVWGDSGRLVQIMNNLVGNSAKFTTKGEIRIMARPVPNQPSVWAVIVCDTGIGISPDKIENIFLPFHQVDMSISRKYGGSGLGLAIVHELVAAMGGSITVESELGQGTTFTFTIPATSEQLAAKERAALTSSSNRRNSISGSENNTRGNSSKATNNKRLNSAALLQVPEERGLSRAGVSRRDRGLVPPAADETSTASANAGTATDQKGLSSDQSSSSQVHADVRPFHKQATGQWQVLSVDDDMVNQAVIDMLLKPDGYDIVKAMSGGAALEHLHSCATFPDLILLDVMMPGMSGYEVCLYIREHFPGQEVPIIMVSAKSGEKNVVQGLHCGCNDYVIKPFNRDELKARISVYLKPDRQRVDLRTRALATSPAAGEAADAEAAAPAGARAVRIVVINRDPVGLMQLENLLRAKAYDVVTYPSVEAAEPGLQTLVHAVLLSIHDGDDVETAVKSVRATVGNTAPVVLMVDALDEHATVQGLLHGADDAIKRPYRVDEVIARIQTHVRRFTQRVEGVDSISMKVLAKVLPDQLLQRVTGPQCVIADTHRSMLLCVCELDDFSKTCGKAVPHNTTVMLNKIHSAFYKAARRLKLTYIQYLPHVLVAIDSGVDSSTESEISPTPMLSLVGEMLGACDSISNPVTRQPIRLRVALHRSMRKMMGGVIFAPIPRYFVHGPCLDTTMHLAGLCQPNTVMATATFASVTTGDSRALLQQTEWKLLTDVGSEVSLSLVRIGDWEAAAEKIAKAGTRTSTQVTSSPFGPDAQAIMKRMEDELVEMRRADLSAKGLIEAMRAKIQSQELKHNVYAHLQSAMKHLASENEQLRVRLGSGVSPQHWEDMLNLVSDEGGTSANSHPPQQQLQQYNTGRQQQQQQQVAARQSARQGSRGEAHATPQDPYTLPPAQGAGGYGQGYPRDDYGRLGGAPLALPHRPQPPPAMPPVNTLRDERSWQPRDARVGGSPEPAQNPVPSYLSGQGQELSHRVGQLAQAGGVHSLHHSAWAPGTPAVPASPQYDAYSSHPGQMGMQMHRPSQMGAHPSSQMGVQPSDQMGANQVVAGLQQQPAAMSMHSRMVSSRASSAHDSQHLEAQQQQQQQQQPYSRQQSGMSPPQTYDAALAHQQQQQQTYSRAQSGASLQQPQQQQQAYSRAQSGASLPPITPPLDSNRVMDLQMQLQYMKGQLQSLAAQPSAAPLTTAPLGLPGGAAGAQSYQITDADLLGSHYSQGTGSIMTTMEVSNPKHLGTTRHSHASAESEMLESPVSGDRGDKKSRFKGLFHRSKGSGSKGSFSRR